MIFSAVLDANVLYPFSLRDTLLRLAELELYRPLWSGRILEEMRQALLEHGVGTESAQRLVETMRDVFEEAEVDEDEIARLEPAMTNEPGDRHVLACAVAADSEVVVTSNLAHFPTRRASRWAWRLDTPTSSSSTSSISRPRESALCSKSRRPT